MPGDVVDIHWPLAGLSRRMGFQQTEPYTTYDCLNVRNQDVFQQRLRGGSRPGLVQVLPPKSFEVGDEPSTTPVGPFDFAPSKDAYIQGHSSLDQNNYGSTGWWEVGNNSGVDNPLRSLVHFDLTTGANPVTVGATITSATLSFFVSGAGASTEIAAKIYRIIQTAWVETQVSYLVYSTGNGWGANGCALDGTDYSTTTPTPVNWNLEVGGGWTVISGASLVTFVQDAVTNRGRQCHMILRCPDDSFATIGGVFVTVRSLNYHTASYRPKLTLEWTA